ncbi:hypothetical protein FA15DRAFT_578552, partial [Coprinopsis marcescibilis]
MQKIPDWPIPCDLTGVQGFLGTVVGTLCIFIKDLASLAEPLVCLTHWQANFEFGVLELESMEKMKLVVADCPTVRPIDYDTSRETILAVNSSYLAAGYILLQ